MPDFKMVRSQGGGKSQSAYRDKEMPALIRETNISAAKGKITKFNVYRRPSYKQHDLANSKSCISIYCYSYFVMYTMF